MSVYAKAMAQKAREQKEKSENQALQKMSIHIKSSFDTCMT